MKSAFVVLAISKKRNHVEIFNQKGWLWFLFFYLSVCVKRQITDCQDAWLEYIAVIFSIESK